LDRAVVLIFLMDQNLVIQNDQFAPPFPVAALGVAFDWKIWDFFLLSYLSAGGFLALLV